MDKAEQEGLAQAAQATGPERKSRYLLQRSVEAVYDTSERKIEIDPVTSSSGLWEDVGYVEVPQRSHRKTAVVEVLKKLNIGEDGLPQSFRVLDVDAYEPIPVRLERPPAPAAVVKVG